MKPRERWQYFVYHASQPSPDFFIEDCTIKGPGIRIDNAIRRVWKCDECNNTAVTNTTIVTKRCFCRQQGVWMKLIDPPPAFPRYERPPKQSESVEPAGGEPSEVRATQPTKKRTNKTETQSTLSDSTSQSDSATQQAPQDQDQSRESSNETDSFGVGLESDSDEDTTTEIGDKQSVGGGDESNPPTESGQQDSAKRRRNRRRRGRRGKSNDKPSNDS